METVKTEGTADNANFDVAIILPTYCEAENVENLIHTIQNLRINPAILVVDDSSPDGTGKIVKELQKNHQNIVLLSRPYKAGLGTAITKGFDLILSLPRTPEYMITMDADYSHDPRDIPRLIHEAKKGYDVVVGSRYRQGGTVRGWSMARLIISKIANKIAARLVALRINDFTSGFRCYSKPYVQKVLQNLHSQTYEIQIETLRQAHIQNAKVTEIPITFTSRKKGKSKLTINEILSFFLYILKTIMQNKK
jgi:dolichol-phosphate mannosyltransferase